MSSDYQGFFFQKPQPFAMLSQSFLYLLLYIILVDQPERTTATIIIAETKQFENKAIACSENEDCVIQCIAPNSCKNAEIQCPMDHKCNITCSGSNACQHSTFTA